MSLIEQAKTRLEEVRTKGARAIVEERFPKLMGSSGGRILGSLSGSASPELPTLKEIREKGVLTILEGKFPRVKELRERRILGILGPAAKEGGTKETSPATKEPPIVDRQEPVRTRTRVLV